MLAGTAEREARERLRGHERAALCFFPVIVGLQHHILQQLYMSLVAEVRRQVPMDRERLVGAALRGSAIPIKPKPLVYTRDDT